MKPNKLFIDTNDNYKLAHIGWGDRSQQFFGYIEGYKIGVDSLVEKAITSKNISILDTMVYPALFLYRQFLELQLKQILLLYSEKTYAEKKDVINKVGHNLNLAWGEVKSIIEGIVDDHNWIKEIEELIFEFHRFDESSFNFRYPIKKKDLNVVINISERIDLQVVKSQMDKIDGFFCEVGAMLEDNQPDPADMRDYYEI